MLKGEWELHIEAEGVRMMGTILSNEGTKVQVIRCHSGDGTDAGTFVSERAYRRACYHFWEKYHQVTVATTNLEKERKANKRLRAALIILAVVAVLLSAVLVVKAREAQPMPSSSIGHTASTVRPTPSPVKKETQTAIPTQDPDEFLIPASVENGEILYPALSEQLAPLTVTTIGDGGYYVYLDPVDGSGDNAMGFYVDGGRSTEVLVPLGEYEIYYASGDTWYGLKHKFGSKTVYSKCDDIFDFADDGYEYTGWTIELYKQYNGNLDVDEINESEFPG